MIEPQPSTRKDELTLLHAATCLSMTQFINGHQCPKLAHIIVHQLNQLLEHPELETVSKTRETYLQLLDHWQKIVVQLLEQRKARKFTVVYH